jgi:hypothetical protein
MYLEHIVYSSAIALLVGLAAIRLHRRDYSWIIIVFAYAPDSDVLLSAGNWVLSHFFHAGIRFPFQVLHSVLHTLPALIVFALFLGAIFTLFGIPFLTGFVYGSLAYGAHFFEDALVYSNPGYHFLWPIIPQEVGMAAFGTYQLNFFGVADLQVLLVGIIFLLFALAVRIYYE